VQTSSALQDREGPASQPAPPADAPPSPFPSSYKGLRFGETWPGARGLSITAKTAPYMQYAHYPILVTFTVENKTGLTLDFEAPAENFYFGIDGGQVYKGTGAGATFNRFDTDSKREFKISFEIAWRDYDAKRLQPSACFIYVGVRDFNSRIKEARWYEDLYH
jgi:hypothetical protein